MIESLFKQRCTRARLQSGPLAQHLPFIAEVLHEEQYRPESIRRYLRIAEGLGRWLCKRGLSVAETDEATIKSIVLERRCGGKLMIDTCFSM
jgi:hypothetical protein